MVSSASSLSVAQIAAARTARTQPLFFQLYKHRDDAAAAARVREVERLGFRAIFLTVDAPVGGNRERDVRAPFELEDMERGGEARAEDALQGEEKGVNLDGTIGNSLHSMDADMTFAEVSHGAGAVAVHGRVQSWRRARADQCGSDRRCRG